MVLYFSGTGNSRYLARRIAEGLEMPLYDLNACIKAGDTAPVQTGRDVVLVTPTYAWRIPRVVSEWLDKTELTGACRKTTLPCSMHPRRSRHGASWSRQSLNFRRY